MPTKKFGSGYQLNNKSNYISDAQEVFLAAKKARFQMGISRGPSPYEFHQKMFLLP